MRPHPHIRKTIKWGGAAATALLVLVWIGSGWCMCKWVWSPGYVLIVRSGRANVVGLERGASSTYFTRESQIVPFSMDFSPRWHFTQGFWAISVPLWLPAAVSVVITAAAWRLDTITRRRALLNLCPKCNYDRAGLVVGAVCPECGTRRAGMGTA